MNREQAIAAGESRYIGRVCASHPDSAGVRYACNFRCVNCALAATLRHLGTDHGRKVRQAYLQTESGRAMMKRARKRTPRKPAAWPTRAAYSADYRARNKDKITATKRFQKAVREAHVSKLATPQWADKAAIARTYSDARRATQETGVLHVVDHFYPLAGKTVCGLHVQDNLRVVTSEANLRKNNRFPAEG